MAYLFFERGDFDDVIQMCMQAFQLTAKNYDKMYAYELQGKALILTQQLTSGCVELQTVVDNEFDLSRK